MCNALPEHKILSRIPWRGRAILLLDLDAFFASVEQMDHPDWKGLPVIVGGDPTKRGVVSTCSYEARKYGVRSAMPSSIAASLCPDAIWVSGRHHRYAEVSKKVMAALYDESPFIQQVSVDEAFLDITPGTHVNEHPVDIASRIQRRVNAMGITCSIGLGTSKTVAKIASDMDKPKGFTVVFPGQEEEFLAPLPIGRMSGIGKVAQQKLGTYRIKTLGQLACAEGSILAEVFGKNAKLMQDRAKGIDDSPVESDDEIKSISSETSFAVDIDTREDIEAAINTASGKVARRLRKKGLFATSLTLKMRFHNLKIKTAQMQLPQKTQSEFEMQGYLCTLLDEAWTPGTPLRLVGVAAAGFDKEPEAQQASLFEEDPSLWGSENSNAKTPKSEKASGLNPRTSRKGNLSKLSEATDAIRNKFGESAVSFGSERRTKQNLTGSGAKNPEDYK